jgi:putative ABC transport system permease protein
MHLRPVVGTLLRHPLWHLMSILILAGGMIPLVATWSFFRTARDLETLGGNWEIILGPRGAALGSPIPLDIAEQIQGRLAGKASVSILAATTTWVDGHRDGKAVQQMEVDRASLGRIPLERLRGRTLGEEDFRPGAAPVALISRAFLNQYLDGDPSAIGRTVLLGGQPVQIIGLLRYLPPSMANCSLVRPLRLEGSTQSVQVLVDQRANRGDLERELQAIASPLAGTRPDVPQDSTLGLARPQRVLDPRGILLLLGMGLATFVTACTAVSAILLAMGAERMADAALRTTLGANRLHLLLEHLSPSLILAGVSAGLAWVPALGLKRAMLAQINPELAMIRPDGIGLIMGVACIGLCAALGAGIWPAWKASGANPALLLGQGFHITPRTTRLQRALTATQIAIGLALVGAASLAWHHVHRQEACDPVPAWRELVTIRVDPHQDSGPARGLPPDPSIAEADLARLRALLESTPGVRQVTGDFGLEPFRNQAVLKDRVKVEGQADWHPCSMDPAGPGWTEIRGLRTLLGRPAQAPDEAVISRSLATHLFASATPLGRRLNVPSVHRGEPLRSLEVVGVVENTHSPKIAGRSTDQLLTFERQGFRSCTLRLIDASPRSLNSLASHLETAFPNRRVALRSGIAAREDALALTRFVSALLTGLGLWALLLAVGGIAGLQAFLVSQRRREFGIRAALGADLRRLATLVMKEGIQRGIWGLPFGVLGVWALGKIMSTAIQGIQVAYLPGYLVPVFIFLLVQVLAGLPALMRIGRMDPAEALHTDG